jgi:hypothetical protein
VTDARVTQAAAQQWMNASVQAQLTQVAVEEWGLSGAVGTQAILTQVALQQWAKVVQPKRAKAGAMVLA